MAFIPESRVMLIESINPTLGNDFPDTPHPFERRPTLLFEPNSEFLLAARANDWVVQVLVTGTPEGKYDGYFWARVVSTMKRPSYFAVTGGRKYQLKLYTVWRGYTKPVQQGQLGSLKIMLGAVKPETVTQQRTRGPGGTIVYRSPDAFAPAWVPAGPLHNYPSAR